MSKEKVRLYQLARELEVDSKRLIDLLIAAGVDVKNHMTALDAQARQLAVELVSGRVRPESVRPAPVDGAAPPRPAAIPEPRGRRLVALPQVSRPAEPAAVEVAPALVEETPPAAPLPPEPPSDEPVDVPPPEVAVAAAVETPAAPVPPVRSAEPPPIPIRPGGIPTLGATAGSLGGPAEPSARRTARERRLSQPRVHLAPPPVLAPRLPPAPKKEEGAQQPVLRHHEAEALLRGQQAPPAPPAPTTTPEVSEDEKGKAKKRGGVMSGREERQNRRNQRAAQRRQVVDVDEDEGSPATRQQQARTRLRHGPQAVARPRRVVLESPITVRSFSEAVGIRANQLLASLLQMGVITNINGALTDETAEHVAVDLGLEVEIKRAQDAESRLAERFTAYDDRAEDRVPRPPVVTFMGHVDHGKTSLMDRIRSTNVAASESGGITQHIGAYRVETKDRNRVTFLDTPGHEAFTAMRARGATVTDIVVLVVAADDGVMPQTEEAIDHAKAAGVPIVVAINKVDLPGANLERVQQQLSHFGLIPEEWGGETLMVLTSAATGQGIDALVESLALQAMLGELRANPQCPASGTCIEASLNEGRGVQVTLLVRHGTLRIGDDVLCGSSCGRVRAMFDDRGRPLEQAGPSDPVVIMGLDEVPQAGEAFFVVDDPTQGRHIAEQRRTRRRDEAQTSGGPRGLEEFYAALQEKKVGELALIIKADVRGSLEAIRKEIDKLHHDEVRVSVKHQGVGAVTESDVLLADASNAIILGFNVVADDRAQAMAAEKKVEVRRYDIIYQVADDIRKALEGLLEPETRELQLGRTIVQKAFSISRLGTVAGCRVLQGTVERNAKVRVVRDGVVIGTYGLDSLRRVKDDVREVREGLECGIKLAGFDDIKPGDILESFRIEQIKRTLATR